MVKIKWWSQPMCSLFGDFMRHMSFFIATVWVPNNALTLLNPHSYWTTIFLWSHRFEQIQWLDLYTLRNVSHLCWWFYWKSVFAYMLATPGVGGTKSNPLDKEPIKRSKVKRSCIHYIFFLVKHGYNTLNTVQYKTCCITWVYIYRKII